MQERLERAWSSIRRMVDRATIRLARLIGHPVPADIQFRFHGRTVENQTIPIVLDRHAVLRMMREELRDDEDGDTGDE